MTDRLAGPLPDESGGQPRPCPALRLQLKAAGRSVASAGAAEDLPVAGAHSWEQRGGQPALRGEDAAGADSAAAVREPRGGGVRAGHSTLDRCLQVSRDSESPSHLPFTNPGPGSSIPVVPQLEILRNSETSQATIHFHTIPRPL